MKRLLASAGLFASLSFALGLVASDADASYTGTITRSMCPQYLISPFWDSVPSGGVSAWSAGSGNCAMVSSGSPGDTANAWLAIPYDAESAGSSMVTMRYAGYGTDPIYSRAFCVETYSFDSSGNYISSVGQQCTSGTSLTLQSISQTVTGPGVGGGIVAWVSGEGTSTLSMVQMEWTVQ